MRTDLIVPVSRWLTAALAAVACAACAADAALGAVDAGQTVALPPIGSDAAPPTSGCKEMLRIADDQGCRGEWTCVEPATRTLLCVQTTSGTTCRCEAEDEEGEELDAGPRKDLIDRCATPADVTRLAESVCGWRIP